MRLTITLLFSILFSFANAAQDPSSALLLQSGTVYPESNLDKFIAEPVNQDEVTDGFYFRIVQFSKYPDLQLQKEIAASGIILNNYLPYRSYNAAIPVSFDKRRLIALKISSVMKWEDQYKLSRKINGQDFPAYSIIVKGNADVVVHCQQNINAVRAEELLKNSGFTILASIPVAHSFTIRLPFEKLNALLSVPFVYFIEPVSMPSTKDDTEGRSLHRSNFINSDYATGRHYDGDSVVIGLADDGEIGPHIDFSGRIIQHLTGAGGNHGDMTSGICVGAGNLIPRIRGMATGATLHVFDISTYPQIINAVPNYQNYGIVITSTSYAQNCNEYNGDSQLGDKLLNENSQFSFVFSAGNNGTGDCQYGAGTDWGNITGGYKMGKNVIAVGNLRNTDSLESSSSRGPAIDGRIKPEICSNGYDQRSTDQDNQYQVGGGTSAACPGVAGCLAQLYQAYKKINNTTVVPSGLIKACILNSAQDLGNPGPDFKFGWGRIDAYKALLNLENHTYFADTISQGQTHTQTITVPPGTTELRVMIYWHDVEGAVNSAKNLVNDLNLRVLWSAQPFLPLVLDPSPNIASLTSVATAGVDSLNNAEQVRIDHPAPGTYNINVDGFQVPVGVQNYYIVYEFNNDNITVTYPNGGEGLVPVDIELIRWDATGNNGTFDIDYSDNNGSSWNSVATGIAGDVRHYSWMVPITTKDQCLIRVTRGSNSDVSDTVFTIIRTPANLHVTFSCPDSIGLAWTAVSGATGYDVSMLGQKYMDYVGSTSGTSYTITGTNPITDYWFSVKAIAPNGGKGCRANAINKQPGLSSCNLAMDGGVTIASLTSGPMTDCQNTSTYPLRVNVANPGLNPISNFNLSYSIDNAAVITETCTQSIAAGTSAIYTFAQTLNLATGHHTITAWITLSGDMNSYNDSVTISFDVIAGTAGTTGAAEPFTSFNTCSTSSNC
jgi:hypothetical protein